MSVRDDSVTTGGRISFVEPGGPAARAGLQVGDVILTADGTTLRDEVDWRWLADGASVTVRCPDPSSEFREITLDRESGESWGLEFETPVFDGIRTCANACTFCFVTQLPPDARPSLRVKDDDYRLSFLSGTFITLSNLSDSDVDRIIDQDLSPLHVSLHAVDPGVRRGLLGRSADKGLRVLEDLLEAGIEFHAQVVLVPGVNDGAVLDETIEWCAERGGILSLGVVPVGVTRYAPVMHASYTSPEASRVVIDQLAPWQEAFREEHGATWVQAADEFYLNAGVHVPPAEQYDGFPQYENGIGLVRTFLDVWSRCVDSGERTVPGVFVTGTLFAPMLEGCVGVAGGDSGSVLSVENEYLGGGVNVTGLLGGGDIARAIAGSSHAGPFLIPDVCVNDDGLFIDDWTLDRIASHVGKSVRLVSSDALGLFITP